MSDREQLIRQIAEETHNEDNVGAGTIVCWHCQSAARAAVDALDRLGFAVVPVSVPGEPPESSQERRGGVEATESAERRVLDAAEAWVGANRYDVYNSWDAQLAGAVGDMVHGRRRAAVETEETPT